MTKDDPPLPGKPEALPGVGSSDLVRRRNSHPVSDHLRPTSANAQRRPAMSPRREGSRETRKIHEKISAAPGARDLPAHKFNRRKQRKQRAKSVSVPSVASCSNPSTLLAAERHGSPTPRHRRPGRNHGAIAGFGGSDCWAITQVNSAVCQSPNGPSPASWYTVPKSHSRRSPTARAPRNRPISFPLLAAT